MKKLAVIWVAGFMLQVAGVTRALDNHADHDGAVAPPPKGGAPAVQRPEGGAEGAKIVWQCPMHPQIVRDQPGECPICHMDLEKVELGAPSSKEERQERASFDLPEWRQQLIGVKTAKVQGMKLERELRLSARIGGAGVLAQLLEIDAGQVQAGQKASLRGPAGQSAQAVVTGVDPNLDSYTRTFAVSLRPESRESWMRPGIFVEARVRVPLAHGLTVPEDSVVDDGEQPVVFVKSGNSFEPRPVILGPSGEGWVRVEKGLKEGEVVVRAPLFLIDSEARFKAAAHAFHQHEEAKP